MNGSQTQQGSFSTLRVLHYAFVGFIFVAGFVAYELVNAKKSTVLLNDDQQSILTILMVMAISIFSISWFVPIVKIRSGIEVDQDDNVSDADFTVFIYSRAAFEFCHDFRYGGYHYQWKYEFYFRYRFSKFGALYRPYPKRA